MEQSPSQLAAEFMLLMRCNWRDAPLFRLARLSMDTVRSSDRYWIRSQNRAMRRLIFSTTALIVVFSLTAPISILIGRHQPLPERVAMLHLTDCELPCWIGIVPGKTTVGEAVERVKQT